VFFPISAHLLKDVQCFLVVLRDAQLLGLTTHALGLHDRLASLHHRSPNVADSTVSA
jgi:hypothetical protein